MNDIYDALAALGAQVRQWRIARGLTQQELAERVGLTRASITNLERGSQNIGYAMVTAIAEALALTVAQLVGTKIEPSKPVRFAVTALYDRLDTARRDRGRTWRDIARDAQLSPSTLTRMSQGHAPNVDGLARVLRWLGDTDIDPYIEE